MDDTRRDPPGDAGTGAATPPRAGGPEGTFTVVLASTGRSFEVPHGHSILTVLEENGVHPAYSCREGECGTCVVQVLEGEPEHRDFILSENERTNKRLMTICVSGSKSKRLVIDL